MYSPLKEMGYDYRYGFCSWLEAEMSEEMSEVVTGDVVSSAGFNGFVPWVDRRSEYVATVCSLHSPQKNTYKHAHPLSLRR